MKEYIKNIKHIIDCFKLKKLPGLSAQMKMAPVTRLVETAKMRKLLKNGNINDGTHKKSAVLILFYPKNGLTHLVLMVRAKDEGVHSGQISFPGGKAEKFDESIYATALREANEEIGIDPSTIKIIGALTKLYIPPSNFDVYPIVGITYTTPAFKPNIEVDKLLEVELNTLVNPNCIGYSTVVHRTGNEFVVPCYNIDNHIVWGATAMMISELVEVVG